MTCDQQKPVIVKVGIIKYLIVSFVTIGVGAEIVYGVSAEIYGVIPVEPLVEIVMSYEACSRWHDVPYTQLFGDDLKTAREIVIDRLSNGDDSEFNKIYERYTLNTNTDDIDEDAVSDAMADVLNWLIQADLPGEWALHTRDVCERGLWFCVDRDPFVDHWFCYVCNSRVNGDVCSGCRGCKAVSGQKPPTQPGICSDIRRRRRQRLNKSLYIYF